MTALEKKFKDFFKINNRISELEYMREKEMDFDIMNLYDKAIEAMMALSVTIINT